MNIIRFVLLLTAISGILIVSTSCSNTYRNKMLKHIQRIDIDRYTGTWYEIARFPHRFEKDLVGVTATYTLLPNGRIEVLNKGFKYSLDGEEKKAIGKAKSAADPSFGYLKVAFFWIFYADYLVLALDHEKYSYALVGSSTPNFLWILSRSPQMDDETLEMLKAKAIELGYDLEKLEMVAQAIE